MARGNGFAQALADGIMGYVKGTQMQRGMDREDEDRAFREEQRTNLRTDRERLETERRQMADAGRTVEVEQGAGGMIRPASADDRDVGTPGDVGQAAGGLTPGYRVGAKSFDTREAADAAATAHNAPEAVGARQVSVLRAMGKAGEAQQLETAQIQGKSAKFTLDREQEKWLNEQFDQRLSSIDTADELAQILSSGERKFATVASADGKTVQLVRTGPDGQQVKVGKEIDNTPEGINKAIVAHSKTMGTAQKAAFFQQARQFDAQRADRAEDVTFRDRQQDSTEKHQRAMEGNAAAGLGLQRDTFNLTRDKFEFEKINTLPPQTKIVVEGLKDTVKMMDTAIAKAQAEGTWDPKAQNSIDLLDKRDAAQRQINQHMKPYLPGAKPGAGEASPAGGQQSAARSILTGGKAPAAAGKPEPGSGSAPAPGPVRSVMTVAQQQQPTAVAAAPAQAAQPQRDPVLAALNPSGNASLDAIAQQRAPALRDAATALQQAQAEVVQAAQGGGNVGQATARAQAALNAIDKMTADMEPGMARAVRQSLGLM